MKNRFRWLLLLLLMCLPLTAQLLEATGSLSPAEIDVIQKRLEQFSPGAISIINRGINFQQFDGVIPSRVVDKLTAIVDDHNVSDVMLKFLPLASYYALPVISNFHVGAVAQGESGALYLGANLEVAGVGLNNSIHAEQSAVNNALLHREEGITRVAINYAPCGHCRQFLNEIKDSSAIEIIVLGSEPKRLKDLLPQSFGPVDLGSTTPLFVMDESRLAVNQKICETMQRHAGHGADDACTHSYAPHTGSLSSVRLSVSDEIYAVGVYIENAAYNPSLSPFLSALDRLRFQERDLGQIKEVVLFELNGAHVSHEIHTSSLISLIAPGATVKIIKID